MMPYKKNLAAKKEYVYWFLTSYKLKWSHVAKLLYFIYNSDSLLERTNFSKYLSNYPNTLLLSAEGSKTFPFICKIKDKFYNDIDQIIEILQHDPPETIVCRLSAPPTPACLFCSQPRRLKMVRKSRRVIGKDKDNLISFLTKAIDKALDNNNKQEFLRLSKELIALLNNKVELTNN